MQVVFALVLLTAVATQGFFLSRGCKSDSDCNNGCCESNFFSSHCVPKGGFLQFCSTNGCGCKADLKCVKESEVSSVAIEIPTGSDRMVCESKMAPMKTTMAPMKTTMAPMKTTMTPMKTSMAPMKTKMAPMKTTMAPMMPTS